MKMTQIVKLAEKHFIAANINIINDLKENTVIIGTRFILVNICFSNCETSIYSGFKHMRKQLIN